MRRPPPKLVQRLVSASEEVLRPDRALRLEDIATLIGSAPATLYYHFSRRDDLVAFLLEEHLPPAPSRRALLSDTRARRVPGGAALSMRRLSLLRGSHRTIRDPHGREGREA